MATQGKPGGGQSQNRNVGSEFSPKLKEFPHFSSFMTAAAHAAAVSAVLDCGQLPPAHTRLPQYALSFTFMCVAPAGGDGRASQHRFASVRCEATGCLPKKYLLLGSVAVYGAPRAAQLAAGVQSPPRPAAHAGTRAGLGGVASGRLGVLADHRIRTRRPRLDQLDVRGRRHARRPHVL